MCRNQGTFAFLPLPSLLLLFWVRFHISPPTLNISCSRALIWVMQGKVLSEEMNKINPGGQTVPGPKEKQQGGIRGGAPSRWHHTPGPIVVGAAADPAPSHTAGRPGVGAPSTHEPIHTFAFSHRLSSPVVTPETSVGSGIDSHA